jgi:hypothetical protein
MYNLSYLKTLLNKLQINKYLKSNDYTILF